MTRLLHGWGRVGPGGRTLVLAVTVLVAAGAAVFLARQPLLAALAAGAGLVIFALPNPVIALSLYAASIPFDDVLSVPFVGAISRFTGLVFLASVALDAVQRRRPPKWTHLPVAGWIFLCYAFASLLWSVQPQVGGFFTLAQLIVSAWLVGHVVAMRPGTVTATMNWYAVGAVILAGMGVADFVRSGSVNNVSLARAAAFDAQSVAHFAAYLLPALLYGLVRLVTSQHAATILRFGLVASVTGLAVLLSGTRSAWVGAVGAIATVVTSGIGSRRVIRLALALGVVAAVATASPQVRDFVTVRILSATESGGAGRTDIWTVGLTLVGDHFLIGAGFKTFPLLFDHEAIARTWRLNEAVSTGRAAHNIYLATLVELGLIGLAAWLVWTGGLVRRLWSLRSTTGLFVLALVVAYLIQGAFLDIMNRKYLFLALGFAGGLATRTSEDAE